MQRHRRGSEFYLPIGSWWCSIFIQFSAAAEECGISTSVCSASPSLKMGHSWKGKKILPEIGQAATIGRCGIWIVQQSFVLGISSVFRSLPSIVVFFHRKFLNSASLWIQFFPKIFFGIFFLVFFLFRSIILRTASANCLDGTHENRKENVHEQIRKFTYSGSGSTRSCLYRAINFLRSMETPRSSEAMNTIITG